MPPFIPGLTIVADRIEIKLINALSQFNPENFRQAFYDTVRAQRNTAVQLSRATNGDIVHRDVRVLSHRGFSIPTRARPTTSLPAAQTSI